MKCALKLNKQITHSVNKPTLLFVKARNSNNYSFQCKQSFSTLSFRQTSFQTSLFSTNKQRFHSTPKKNISNDLREALLSLYKIPIDARVPNYKYDTSENGDIGTKDFEVKLVCSTEGSTDYRQVSPWLDITLYYFPANVTTPSKHFPATISSISKLPSKPKPKSSDGNLVHMVCEIPKGTNAKLEVNLEESYHSIKQDIDKEGNPRFIKHGNLPFNYGMLPQTYEDPSKADPFTGLLGDGDPVDVVEIGSTNLAIGEVSVVKPLGSLALIDEGQTDWKVIAIDTNDPLADQLNDITDVEKHLPGLIDQIREWYRVYKVAEGKGENSYSFDGKAMSKDFTDKLIFHSHKTWRTSMIEQLTAYHKTLTPNHTPYKSYDSNLDLNPKKV